MINNLHLDKINYVKYPGHNVLSNNISLKNHLNK